MTDAVLPLPAVPRPASRPRALTALTLASAVALACFLVLGALDGRTLNGEPVWLKPAKFALSFLPTFGMLAWLQSRLSRPWAEGWTLRATAAVICVAAPFELAYIAWQAGVGEASHFNEGTPFHAAMYAAMGIGAVALVLCIGVFGVVALADRGARLAPGMRFAVGVGFLATVLLTLPVAITLGGNGGHFVGVPPAGAPTWPILGWSGAVGDLRPAHFLALHTMQAIPLWAWARGRIGRLETLGVALLWAALTLAVFAQALAGRPLVAL